MDTTFSESHNIWLPPQCTVPTQQPCYQPTVFPVQGQHVPERFIRRPFDEELQAISYLTWQANVHSASPAAIPLTLNLVTQGEIEIVCLGPRIELLDSSYLKHLQPH
jgi:hypothetical protein